jgi:hypothetical protein
MKIEKKLQEVLVLFNTNFSRRNWLVGESDCGKKYFSQKENLIEICWSGKLPKLLPECFDFCFDDSLHLWEMNDLEAFIELSYANFIPAVANIHSVNPYHFLAVQGYN